MDANRAAQQLRREGETAEGTRLDASRAAQQLRREGETAEARQTRLNANRAAQQLKREGESAEGVSPVCAYELHVLCNTYRDS